MTLNEIYRAKWARPRAGERFPKHEAMLALWKAFPNVAGFAPADGVFDADQLIALLEKGWAPSERAPLLFLLAVWNPAHFSDGFDLVNCVSEMDPIARAVVADWTLNPWWP